MRIPAYQIYNVLKQYTDQLTSGSGSVESGIVHAKPADDAGFYATVKRRELIETIKRTIKDNISQVIVPDPQGHESMMLSSKAAPREAGVKQGNFSPFVYNEIDKDHHKVKRTLSVTRFYEP